MTPILRHRPFPAPAALPPRFRILLPALCALALALVAGRAGAQTAFLYGGEPVHPGCVHAIAMPQGERVPVVTAVSLEGCMASERANSAIRWEDDVALIEDEALLGGGSFGYREIARLDNGIIGLAIHRVPPEGEEQVSLAAVELVERPMIRHGKLVRLTQLELLGEVWIPGMDVLSLRAVGNVVHFTAGTGPDRVERHIDFTRLGRLRH